MNFWKRHLKLRAVLMVFFLVAGLLLTLLGWSMTGQLVGLGLMLAGIVLMLSSLFLYNKTYQ